MLSLIYLFKFIYDEYARFGGAAKTRPNFRLAIVMVLDYILVYMMDRITAKVRYDHTTTVTSKLRPNITAMISFNHICQFFEEEIELSRLVNFCMDTNLDEVKALGEDLPLYYYARVKLSKQGEKKFRKLGIDNQTKLTNQIWKQLGIQQFDAWEHVGTFIDHDSIILTFRHNP